MSDDLRAQFAMRLTSDPTWRWASLIPAMGYARCYRCRRPWWRCEPRHVDFQTDLSHSRGQFALCVACWDKSSFDERVHAHAWVCSRWSAMADEELSAIYGAIKRDSET